MVGYAEVILLFQWIFVITVVILVFGFIALIPLIVNKLLDNIEWLLKRRKFIRDLTRSLQQNLIENLDNIESIFLISFPRTQDYPFVLNNELRHFIGLITSGYQDIFNNDINFRQTPPDVIRGWRTLIENIINLNQERLFYADLPLDDRVAFQEILDYIRDNYEAGDNRWRFIRTRLMEIKRKTLKKNEDLKRSQYINYGAIFVSIVGVILTIVFGLRLIG